MALLSKLKVLCIKAFVGGEWEVAYRQYGERDCKYTIVDAPKDTCIADPFLYYANDKHYLFVELFENRKNKACIAYYEFVNGKPVYQGKIIEQPYHMSYPCVFEYKGEHYMIPETSANHSIDIYKATKFPTGWEKIKCLVSGTRYVDTTVFRMNGGFYAVSYQKTSQGWRLDAFILDMENLSMKMIASKCYAANIGRPAGNFICDHELLRPAQNCSVKYGEHLILYSVDQISATQYDEHEKTRINAHNLPLDDRPERVHTYNRDNLYECVDVYYEKIDPLHGAKTLWRAYLRKYFKG